MKTIKLECEECKKEFERPLKEFKRNAKIKRKKFCSLSCSMTYNNKHNIPVMSLKRRIECGNRIKKHAGNHLDEFSPFRGFINSGKASIKKHGHTLTPKYLKQIWEQQKGICPYTNIKMILPANTLASNKTHSLIKASLDRIDSSKGYEPGNVEFVCCAINYAKNSFTRKEMKEFIAKVVEMGEIESPS